MAQVNVHEARTHLSRLLRRVKAGEQIVIADAGRPVARLVPIEPPWGPRVLGADRGTIWISDDFDAPLPSAVLDTFHAGSLEPARTPRRTRPKRRTSRAR